MPRDTKNPEIGDLSRNELVHLNNILGEVLDDAWSFGRQLCATERGDSVLGHVEPWAPLYDLPLICIVLAFVQSIGELDTFREITSGNAPYSSLLDWAESAEPFHSREISDVSDHELAQFASFGMALQLSMTAVAFYGRSMSALVKSAEKGCKESLNAAVSIDPTCIATPSIARLLSHKEFQGQLGYRKHVAKFVGNGPHGRRKNYKHLRALYVCLCDIDCRAVKDMSESARYELFAGILGRYGQGRDRCDARSLTALFNHWDGEISPAK